MAVYDRELGFKSVGSNVRVTGLVHFAEPWLITIGSRVTIADGVRFLCHDGAVALFRDEFPDLLLHLPITVGSRVFIGADAILLPGVNVGDDSIVGAGSVVTKDVPAGTVVAGNPARHIKTIAEYREGLLNKLPRSQHHLAPSTRLF